MALLLGLGAFVALCLIGLFAPRAAAGGWLVAFAFIADIALGALALLLIHRLTGGAWGETAWPALSAATTAMPLVLLFFLVALVGLPWLYPWVRDPNVAGPHVAALYLNPLFFAARGIVFLGGVTLAALLVRRRRLGRLGAGLALVWYAVGMDLVAVDWLSSIEPRYTSSAFGAQIIVAQLIAALAWTILATQERNSGPWNDLGSLLLATTLGETYLILMTFIVQWYGDQPHEARWYLTRVEHGWLVLVLAGSLIGSFGPLLALLFSSVRRSSLALKRVAIASLCGVALEMIWLVAPGVSAWSAATAWLAIVAAVALTVALTGTLPVETQREGSHGL